MTRASYVPAVVASATALALVAGLWLFASILEATEAPVGGVAKRTAKIKRVRYHYGMRR